MPMNFKLEICTDNIESAIDAQLAGAHRIELCNDLPEGGTTPGYGTIVSARNNLDIVINVIIRPRGGDFLYSDPEYDSMKSDIEQCIKCRVDGIVLGILRSDGSIDIERTAKLVKFAHPMPVTFHRAFDMCSDPFQGLEDVIASGASRLLTSGQKNKALDGADRIGQLIQQAKDRIIIMPGSGIDDSNIEKIARVTGAKEFHLTGRKIIDSKMIFRKQGISMGGDIAGVPEFSRMVADREKIKRIINILNLI
jgi:copper homeostasis protein